MNELTMPPLFCIPPGKATDEPFTAIAIMYPIALQ